MENTNNYYNTNEPFQLEVEIVDDSKRTEIESLILKSVYKSCELIPGLRINKAYKQSLKQEDIIVPALKDEFVELMKETTEKFDKFINKWTDD